MTHLTMGQGVSGCFGTSLAPNILNRPLRGGEKGANVIANLTRKIINQICSPVGMSPNHCFL